MTDHTRLSHARLRDFSFAEMRWYATASTVGLFLLALYATRQADGLAVLGFLAGLLWSALVAMVAWLDRADRRPKIPGREVAPAIPPSAVENPSTSRPGSGGAS